MLPAPLSLPGRGAGGEGSFAIYLYYQLPESQRWQTRVRDQKMSCNIRLAVPSWEACAEPVEVGRG